MGRAAACRVQARADRLGRTFTNWAGVLSNKRPLDIFVIHWVVGDTATFSLCPSVSVLSCLRAHIVSESRWLASGKTLGYFCHDEFWVWSLSWAELLHWSRGTVERTIFRFRTALGGRRLW